MFFWEGGAMHQRDEGIVQYLETTKQLYKDLLSVHKKMETGKIEISSRVFQVRVVILSL